MRACADLLICYIVRGVFWLLGLLSQPARVVFFAYLFRIAFALLPRLRRTARVNLSIAFPDKSEEWYRNIIRKNATEMGRLLADAVRLPALDSNWVRTHVRIDALERFAEVGKNRGILIATGHLGSFELLGHAIGLLGHPIAAVARRFKSPRLDQWWTGLRESRGNTIIDRTGAFRRITSSITAGTSVAVLFDQNVRIQHAVFVDWFGKQASTTRAFALAALKTQAPVFVTSMKYVGDDHYAVDVVECDFSEIYRDESMSDDEKILRITAEVSSHYCRMIEAFPEGWFWIHRRWKTRPLSDNEEVY